MSALGTHTVDWAWFDEPQLDADGDGPYSGGQIWETALCLLRETPFDFAAPVAEVFGSATGSTSLPLIINSVDAFLEYGI
jgi:hypothetical protein